MLDNYGLHQITWDACNERFTDILVASPADACGRGISLAIRQDGAAADMTGATVYFAWKHKATGKRGTELLEPIDASEGTFAVFYPAALQEAEGAIQGQIVVSRGDDTYISSRVFTIRVEPVVIGGEEHEDGFTLFIEAINAYEHATEITTDAADAANAAATAANNAASNANTVAGNIQAAAQRGDFDGADGQDGTDGFSPTATVTQTASGATITITDKNGTTTADIAKGAQGEKGDTGERGPKGDKGETGDTGPQGIQGETGPKGDTGATGAQGPKGETGDAGATGPQGPKGDKGDTGETGAVGPQGPKGDTGDIGPKGDTGAAGADGSDGVSCTHTWNGTVLSVTSASGTSSADLVGPQGPKGDTGETGATGPAGADGTTFAPISPLSLSNGELSVDLSDCAAKSELSPGLFCGWDYPHPKVGVITNNVYVGRSSNLPGFKKKDFLLDTRRGVLGQATVVTINGSDAYARVKGIFELGYIHMFHATASVDADPGQTVSGTVPTSEQIYGFPAGCIFFNPTTGNLMRNLYEVYANANNDAGTTQVTVVGLCNLYNAGSNYSAASPLSIDSNNEISIDLSAYAALAGATFTGAVSGITPTANAHFATKGYVDGAVPSLSGYATESWVTQQISAAIADLDDLSEEEF